MDFKAWGQSLDPGESSFKRKGVKGNHPAPSCGAGVIQLTDLRDPSRL